MDLRVSTYCCEICHASVPTGQQRSRRMGQRKMSPNEEFILSTKE